MVFPLAALPGVRTVGQCADFSQTVQPYLPELLALPQKFYGAMASTGALKDIYLQTNPLVSAFALSLALAPIFLLGAEINKNYSQVDRFWSILPTMYIGHYTLWAHLVGLPTKNIDNLAVFGLVWSTRLTFNYWRKGGYTIGSEDYRWAVLKEKIGPNLMFVFDVLFISLAQSVLLFLVTTPAYLLLLTSRLKGEKLQMSTADHVFPRLLLGLVLFEFFADGQQWSYQTAKQAYLKTAKVPADSKYSREDFDRGFVTDGLWAWSRHPNFAAEQAIWVVLYQWGVWETDTWFNWTFAGAMSYMILFQASTWFTELISARKYPEYKEYQKLVGKFLPKRLGAGVDVGKADKPVAKKQ